MSRIPDYIIDREQNKKGLFSPGWINELDAKTIPEGAISDGLNWIVKADKIELRHGYKLLGADVGVGQVSGLKVGIDANGDEVLFKTRSRKIEYMLPDDADWTEVGTDSLPAGANADEISIELYTNLAGNSIYFSSPNSGIYKIMLANPDTLIDLLSTTFKGKIRIKGNAMLLWDRLGSAGQKDKTGLYRSKLDKDTYADYTLVSAENIGTGDGTTKTFADILAFKAAGSKRSCFGISATDGTETFSDNYDGTLTGSLGGTGTINYATGAISITFNTAPENLQALTCDYYWEDPTSGGIADFTAPTSPRVAAESFILRQDEGGGNFQNIGEYNNDYYCFHKTKTWKTTISADDTEASNLLYREKVGIPNWRALCETGEGIYYIDTSEQNNIRLWQIALTIYNTEAVPQKISDLIDLSGFSFTKAVLKEFGDYVVIACRLSSATQNNRMLFYDRKLKLWNPPTDLQASVLDIFNGALIGGDSTTNNVYELLSGVDDDDSAIPNFITFNDSNLNKDGLKFPRRFIIRGEIQRDQLLKIYASIDNGAFVEIGEVNGNDDYVNKGTRVLVGTNVVGTKEVGGGGSGIYANYYE